MKQVLNEWQFVFEVRKDYRYLDRCAHRVTFGIFKLTSFSLEGHYPNKDNYKGFLREYSFRFNVKREM